MEMHQLRSRCPGDFTGFAERQCQPQARSRHGVAMGTALRPENGTKFPLEAQTD